VSTDDADGREAYFRAVRRRQPEAELKRKADKARRRQNIWTHEELDYIKVHAARMASELRALMK
jgi:hypothetical protein